MPDPARHRSFHEPIRILNRESGATVTTLDGWGHVPRRGERIQVHGEMWAVERVVHVPEAGEVVVTAELLVSVAPDPESGDGLVVDLDTHHGEDDE